MKRSINGAHPALLLLLGINLFNYIDRQILAALEPDIRASFFATGDVNAMTKTGLLGDAFFVTYMISAPILGFLADRFSRWIIVGSTVILWSLASGGSGLAATFAILFATRICVGIGEGGYGPATRNYKCTSVPNRAAPTPALAAPNRMIRIISSSCVRRWICGGILNSTPRFAM